jgi:hypothetical protein
MLCISLNTVGLNYCSLYYIEHLNKYKGYCKQKLLRSVFYLVYHISLYEIPFLINVTKFLLSFSKIVLLSNSTLYNMLLEYPT